MICLQKSAFWRTYFNSVRLCEASSTDLLLKIKVLNGIVKSVRFLGSGFAARSSGSGGMPPVRDE